MIQSFSRLFRQIFGGARAVHPVTDVRTGAVGADAEAQEAALHRENLKRAMETAFATPTAEAEEPLVLTTPLPAEPELTLVAPAAESEPAAVHEEVHEEVQELAAEVVAEAPEADAEDAAEAPVAEDEDVVAQAAEPVVAEMAPAIELAEVEEHTEYRDDPAAEEPTEIEATVALETTAEDAVEEAPVVEAATLETDAPVEEPVAPEAELAEEAHAPVEETAAVEDEPADELEVTPEAVAEGLAAVASKAKRATKKKAPAKKKAATKKSKPAVKKGALAEDAVWLSDAVAYSLQGEWTNVWTPPEDATGAERLEVFREKAAAGELMVWGRPEGGEEWEAIKAAYWKTSFVEPLSFLMGRENTATEPKPTKGKKKSLKYVALKVSQSAVEQLWPASETQVRDAA